MNSYALKLKRAPLVDLAMKKMVHELIKDIDNTISCDVNITFNYDGKTGLDGATNAANNVSNSAWSNVAQFTYTK